MKSSLTFLFVVCTGLTLPQIVSAQHYRCEQRPVIKLCPPTYSHQPHYGYSETHQQCEPARIQYREVEPVREVCEVSNCISPSVPKVICVQRELTRCGYFLRAPHPANGVCDDQTVEAVRSYQRAKGLPVTGKVDDSLLSAMKIQASGIDTATAPAPAQPPASSGAVDNQPANSTPPPAPNAGPSGTPEGTETDAPNNNSSNNEAAPGPALEKENSKPDTVPAAPAANDSKQNVDEILIAEEVSKLLRVEEKDVVAMFEKGELPGKKFGDSWRTTRGSVIKFLNAQ